MKTRPLSPALQYAALCRALPDSRGSVRGGRLICRGSVQPLPISQRYAVRFELKPKRLPSVTVESPDLTHPEWGKPPHTYDADQPCLFYPADRDWAPSKLWSRTVLPWLLEWLVYYEAWAATGDWQGGGVHPA
jgi:hypothetical protein